MLSSIKPYLPKCKPYLPNPNGYGFTLEYFNLNWHTLKAVGYRELLLPL